MTTSTDLLSTLSDEQLEAVQADGQFVHVSAGPGSGKTRVVAARIAWLIEQGADPSEIACLTFTRSACSEIRSRVAAQVGPVAAAVQISTFHEAALRDGPGLGGHRVASEAEVEAAVQSLYEGPMQRPPSDRPTISKLRRALMQWEAAGGGGDKCVEKVRQRLEDVGLVPTWHLVPRLLNAHHAGEVRTYEHVLVDEGQDVTPAEVFMARSLPSLREHLYVVGDLRQAIMHWRGAEPELWGAPTHRLTRTFRFGPMIAEESNRLEVGGRIVGDLNVPDRVFRHLALDDVGPLCAGKASTAILVRTHSDAEAIQSLLPHQVRHVERDRLDPLSSAADRLAAVTERGFVPVLTVHGAKGREWDRVIVIGPSTIRWGRASKNAEERRVLYVAETRARRELVLVSGEVPEELDWRTRADGICGAPA